MIGQAIVNELRSSIVRGEYKPGERLKENALCTRFKVSRTPIREALKELENMGLVEITPNAGAKVVKLTPEDVSNIYDVLITLDGAVGRLACSKITDAELNTIKGCQFAIQRAILERSYDLVFELNLQFHTLLTESTRNPYLIQIWTNFRHLVNRLSRFLVTPMVPDILKAIQEEHPEIIDAIEKRNPGMAEFMARKHMESGRKLMMGYLEKMQAQ